MKNLEIFIIWEKGRKKEQEILSDIEKKFDIFGIFEISHKNRLSFVKNLRKFYKKGFVSMFKKSFECGYSSFLLVLVLDNNSCIKDSDVNHNIYKNKIYYREMTKGRFLIHASDSRKEANCNLENIIGLGSEEVVKKYNLFEKLNNKEKKYITINK